MNAREAVTHLDAAVTAGHSLSLTLPDYDLLYSPVHDLAVLYAWRPPRGFTFTVYRAPETHTTTLTLTPDTPAPALSEAESRDLIAGYVAQVTEP